LPLKAFIPEDYVADIDTRLSLYQKLARVDKLEQIEALKQEFGDRFGKLPAEVKNLLYALRIKILAAKAGIESVSTEDGEIVIRLFGGMQLDREKLEPLLGEGVTLGKGQIRVGYKRVEGWQKRLGGILEKIG
jgi:transcription-repair coupling factor (superfamily II helicase)